MSNSEATIDVSCNIKQLGQHLKQVLNANLVPLITSSPGLGKSSLAKQLAKEANLKLIDERLAQCDPVDLKGFPRLEGDQATYVPMDTFPIASTPLPKDKNGNNMGGWLLFLDELTGAPLSVQLAAYKIILDRQVGNHDLHPNVWIMAAGNKITDNAVVQKMSTALQSRLVHFELKSDLKCWNEWAMRNDFDPRILAYLAFRPEMFYKFNPQHNDNTFPCPRTWEFVNKLINKKQHFDHLNMQDHLAILAGTIGKGGATEFITYCQIWKDLPDIGRILNNPKVEGQKLSTEPNILYAVSALVASNINGSNADKLFDFIEYLPKEFQIICMQMALSDSRKTGELQAHPALQNWLNKNMDSLI